VNGAADTHVSWKIFHGGETQTGSNNCI